MTRFGKLNVPPDFKSDGCTMPWFLFFMNLFFRKHKDACRWHDWARRHLVHYGIVTVDEADDELYRLWVDSGMWKWFATIAIFVVKKTRFMYKKTQPVPNHEWFEYFDNK